MGFALGIIPSGAGTLAQGYWNVLEDNVECSNLSTLKDWSNVDLSFRRWLKEC